MFPGDQEPDHLALIYTLRAISDSPQAFTPTAISLAAEMAALVIDGRRVAALVPQPPPIDSQTSIYDALSDV